ncbi:MAG: Inorganic triphosphatase [Candidatus Dichloromethanomonas elyunquensis]|nr:MAG: Inorganic triphosphatase [Candidatus Dichloromethanomonas elyunquensis]
MGKEIERKFLVHHNRLPVLTGGERFIQGYLSEKPSVRFRIKDKLMVITVKEYFTGSRRFELETPPKEITSQEIEKLQELAVCPPIVKVRYKIPYHVRYSQDLQWELDVYRGENQGLVTVDIELPGEDYPLEFPDWVDAGKEITCDPRYSNLNLGKTPFSQWS